MSKCLIHGTKHHKDKGRAWNSPVKYPTSNKYFLARQFP